MTIAFCPSCGTMRAPGAMFCTGCGTSFQALMAPCPTCGQLWMPTGAPTGSPVPATPAAVRSDPSAITFGLPPTSVTHGAPTGSPVSAAPAAMAPAAIPVAPAESFLPRGPLSGDDYSADRDCGNCGATLDVLAVLCSSCGSRNTGDTFLPHLLS